LTHPGEFLSPLFRDVPENAGPQPEAPTFQSLWRGLTEVVSIAALLHDLGHVPFGHTLEDEFAGILPKHDRLAGPRLHLMLFDKSSELANVFEAPKPWIGDISNNILRRLIYVILNWKEKIEPPEGFAKLLEKEIKRNSESSEALSRLRDLQAWYAEFRRDKLFGPFMSDIIGNTICSDLLDYLPRDRTYLGMEARHHSRLQRYFTIREGSLYSDEGLRMSIMVTRGAHGGQRRDVATAVLAIMRERYEMAERVYYHHKKAAASAMLAKLMEITPEHLRPRDDERIYPAPWDPDGVVPPSPPHMTHLSDSSLIEYLGHVDGGQNEAAKALQRNLHTALAFRRRDMYRTVRIHLLVSKWNGPSPLLPAQNMVK
jgi:HD superfamily phosphohydrolase